MPAAHPMPALSRSSRTRVGAMTATTVAVGVITSFWLPWSSAALLGWDAAASLFVGTVLIGAVLRMSASETALHALRDDPGRSASDVIVLGASMASLLAVGSVLIHAASQSGSTKDWLALLAVGSVALSWATVHSLYTLRYAALYYDPPVGGIGFEQTKLPAYREFAYVAFTIGMTFQVSDTPLRSSRIRSTALRQALLSYLFGTGVVATMVNLVAGLTTSH